MREQAYLHEQTRRNVSYLIGLNVLKEIADCLCWSEVQFESARAELVRRLSPTLVEI